MKKKILAIVLCIAMLAIAIVGGTMAYFTDEHSQENTFTVGKVDITLDEALVKLDENGNYVADGDARTSNNQKYERLVPTMTVTKDPTITVAEDSEAAYVAAKIIIKSGESGDIESLIPSTNHYQHMLDVSQIISGGSLIDGQEDFVTGHPLNTINVLMPLYGNDNYYTYQEVLTNNGTYSGEYIIYMFVKKPVKAKEKVVLFDTLTVKGEWTNEQMEILNKASITIEAYAVQAKGFTDCYEAMAAAFAEKFPKVPAATP